MAEIILHHYDTSPFSEKARVMFGIKGLSWRSVIQPVIMPKPELVPLTGGYRRIPVMQIGADVYCDTQVILAELERRFPKPAVVGPGDWAINLWADRLWFQTTVAVVFGEIGDTVPEAFIKDREALSGRPFDLVAMKAASGPARGQWRSQAAFVESGLDDEFLGGSKPSLADVAAYMNVWWLTRAAGTLADGLLEGLPRTLAWRARMAALGHGERSESSPGEAMAVAAAAEPEAAVAPGPPAPHAPPLGAKVAVRADDYGREAIVGELAAISSERSVIARNDPEVGRIHVHFPRVGYLLTPA